MTEKIQNNKLIGHIEIYDLGEVSYIYALASASI